MKYSALRITAWVKMICGSLSVFASIIMFSFWRLSSSDVIQALSFPIIFAFFIGGIFLIAFGQLIYVLIDIEFNTRSK
jgi:ribose/xylose/arabinose/galactoside ABC-type transport system permease subunit